MCGKFLSGKKKILSKRTRRMNSAAKGIGRHFYHSIAVRICGRVVGRNGQPNIKQFYRKKSCSFVFVCRLAVFICVSCLVHQCLHFSFNFLISFTYIQWFLSSTNILTIYLYKRNQNYHLYSLLSTHLDVPITTNSVLTEKNMTVEDNIKKISLIDFKNRFILLRIN